MLSFSATVKNEAGRIECPNCCAKAELFSEMHTCAAAKLEDGKSVLVFSTENKAVARRILNILIRVMDIEASVSVGKSRLKGVHAYSVIAGDPSRIKAALAGGGFGNIRALMNCGDCRKAVLRGAFLGGGSVSDPKKNYHLEIVTSSEPFSQLLIELLSYFKIKAKTIMRKQNYVVYLNEGDAIAALLTLIGAHAAVLGMENVRAYKDMRNNVNRAVNCETANINKTVEAALNQLNSINTIEEIVGIGNLSPRLKEAALLRMSHPEASLKELCELSGMTKSGLNHRFRQINTLAKTLAREEM